MRHVDIIEIKVKAKDSAMIWDCLNKAADLAESEKVTVRLIHNGTEYTMKPDRSYVQI